MHVMNTFQAVVFTSIINTCPAQLAKPSWNFFQDHIQLSNVRISLNIKASHLILKVSPKHHSAKEEHEIIDVQMSSLAEISG